MADVILFHHAQGLTDGVLALGERIRQEGHRVWTPDAYDNQTFDSLEDGIAYARQTGFAAIAERFVAATEDRSDEAVYAGISLGVGAAQQLAQTKPGAKGALLFAGCLPPEEFGGGWPATLPVQIHGMADDEWFVEDRPAAEALVAGAERAELFVYAGSKHLFMDNSLPDHDPAAAEVLEQRVLAFLAML